jgi:hypothetical protein
MISALSYRRLRLGSSGDSIFLTQHGVHPFGWSGGRVPTRRISSETEGVQNWVIGILSSDSIHTSFMVTAGAALSGVVAEWWHVHEFGAMDAVRLA